MRRKGFTYYLNTAKLKLANRRFDRLRMNSKYQSYVESNRKDNINRFNSSLLAFPEFSLFYQTYFYFKSTSIFDDVYHFKNGFPVGLKGKAEIPLVPLYYGLVYINTHSDKLDIEKLKDIGEYISELSTKSESGLYLEHKFDYNIFGLKAPWISGITQSIACSFFLRLFILTKENHYLTLAEKFFLPCTKAFQDDGCMVSTKSGLEWVEEYNSKPQTLVLSGHIFAIIAAGELFQLTDKSNYKFVTENWLRSLVHELSSYQFENYIIHNKYQWKLSNIEYQGLYVGQFSHLYKLTGNELFLDLYTYYNNKLNWKSFYSFYGINKNDGEK